MQRIELLDVNSTSAIGAIEAITAISADVNDEFSCFFQSLGYKVTWDFSKRTGERWYEIYDGEVLIVQIPMGVPLAEFLTDLPHFAEGRSGVGPTNYCCRSDDNKKLRALLATVDQQRLASKETQMAPEAEVNVEAAASNACPCGSGRSFVQCHGLRPPATLLGESAPVMASPVMLKLDLACGQSPREGFEGVDIWPKAKHVVDLQQYPWPWSDKSVAEINCSHYIEHIAMEYILHNGKKKDALFAFFDECYRILVPNGWLYLRWPFNRSDRAFWDPTHRRFIAAQTMLYMNREWRGMNKLEHYNVDCNYGVLCKNPTAPSPGLEAVPIIDASLNLLPQDVAQQRLNHWWNVGIDWEAKLQAK